MESLKSLKEGKIIPDVLVESDFGNRYVSLLVKYGEKSAVDGAAITPSEAKKEPAVELVHRWDDTAATQVQFVPSAAVKSYAVLLVDPDAPSAKEAKKGFHYLHWIKTYSNPDGQHLKPGNAIG